MSRVGGRFAHTIAGQDRAIALKFNVTSSFGQLNWTKDAALSRKFSLDAVVPVVNRWVIVALGHEWNAERRIRLVR